MPYINALPKKDKPRWMIVWYSATGQKTITSKTYLNKKTAMTTAEKAMEDVNALYPKGARPYYDVVEDTEENRSGAYEPSTSTRFW